MSEETLIPTALAYACFTSGSTGEPKCVLIQHRAFVNDALACHAVGMNGAAMLQSFEATFE